MSNDKMSNDNILDKLKTILKCNICKDLFYLPITLECQDTICKMCLDKHLNKSKNKKMECPICFKPSFYPPVQNYKIWDIISKIFPEEIKSREEEYLKFENNKSDEAKIRDEIIKTNWRDLINKKIKNANRSNNNLNTTIQTFQLNDLQENNLHENLNLEGIIQQLIL
jgi:hypothetical protein